MRRKIVRSKIINFHYLVTHIISIYLIKNYQFCFVASVAKWSRFWPFLEKRADFKKMGRKGPIMGVSSATKIHRQIFNRAQNLDALVSNATK